MVMTDETLASELLHQIKMNAHRWFIAFVIMVFIEISTIAGFLWYISLPVDEITVESDEGSANYIGRDLEGGLYNGCKDSGQETGGQK